MGAAANRIVEIPPASTTANTKSGNSCAPPFLRYLRIPQSKNQNSKIKKTRLGFDVAASGQGDLAAIYVDEARGNELWLRGLFTCRTEDWHFLKRSCSISCSACPASRPPAMSPAWAAKSAGKPPNSSAAVS